MFNFNALAKQKSPRCFRKQLGVVTLGLLFLAGCASTPPENAPPEQISKPSTESHPRSQSSTSETSTTVATRTSTPSINTSKPGKIVKTSGVFRRQSWSDLPNWEEDAVAEAWPAVRRSCMVFSVQNRHDWKTTCDAVFRLPEQPRDADVRAFFTNYMDPYLVLNDKGEGSSFITGYFEPLLMGSLQRDARFRYPVLGVPDDLVNVDISTVYPQLANVRVRGRLQGKTLVPYDDRAKIVATPPDEKQVLVWVDDAYDFALMQIQGSGRIQLPDNQQIRLGYANHNGHPFVSLGKTLVAWGELKTSEVTAQAIRNWIKNNRRRQNELLNSNPGYVFFRRLNISDTTNPSIPNNMLGPLGALGVPLTPMRSIAVDTSKFPLGAPAFLSMPSVSRPGSREERLVVAQDTGSAIKGGARVDFYWGYGDQAGQYAGVTKQNGRLWLLWPKNAQP